MGLSVCEQITVNMSSTTNSTIFCPPVDGAPGWMTWIWNVNTVLILFSNWTTMLTVRYGTPQQMGNYKWMLSSLQLWTFVGDMMINLTIRPFIDYQGNDLHSEGILTKLFGMRMRHIVPMLMFPQQQSYCAATLCFIYLYIAVSPNSHYLNKCSSLGNLKLSSPYFPNILLPSIIVPLVVYICIWSTMTFLIRKKDDTINSQLQIHKDFLNSLLIQATAPLLFYTFLIVITISVIAIESQFSEVILPITTLMFGMRTHFNTVLLFLSNHHYRKFVRGKLRKTRPVETTSL